MKILNFGSCNIDSVYKVKSIVKPGETISSFDLQIHAGGKGLNQSIAAARSGASVYHAGCIGSDGEFLRRILEEAGADTVYLKETDVPTGHAIIQVEEDSGENSILLFSGANNRVTKEYADGVLENFGAGDIIILQNEISNVPHIIERAYEKGMQTVYNPSPINKSVHEVDLSKVRFLVVNRIEAEEISGKADIDEICNCFTALYPDMKLVLTLGKDGSVFAEGSTRISCKSYPVIAADTTGAGDTFLGYFISCYSASGDAEAALNTASMAAALSVTKDGAAESIPYMSDVMEFEKNL